ncbi:MAG: PIG-L family deacetylase [Pirellulaceae bacterium]
MPKPEEHETTLDVVAVGAHPDDVEIACGGTLAKLVSQGYRVGIIDLTDGEPTPRCDSPEIRLAEARAAADVLGVQVRRILELPNRRLFDCFEARVALAKEFRKYRPKVVIGFGNKTPMASPDHYQAMQITDAAVFYSRLTKWDDYFDGLPVHTVQRQLCFYLGYEPTRTLEFGGNVTVDISEFLDQKIESALCYKTQFPPEKRGALERVKGLAIAAGSAAGFGAGEVFAATRPVGCQDLMKVALAEV